MNDRVAAELRELLLTRPTCADDVRLLRALLNDVCPHDPAEVAALVAACEAGIVGALRSTDRVERETRVARLRSTLADASVLGPEAAAWAVQSWTAALGANTATDQSASQRPAGPAAPTRLPAQAAWPAGSTAATRLPGGSGAPSPVTQGAGPPRVELAPTRLPAPAGSTASLSIPRRGPLRPVVLIAAGAVVLVLGVAAIAVPQVRGLIGFAAPAPSSSAPPAMDLPDPNRKPVAANTPEPLIVIAQAGGGEKYAEETLPALLDGARTAAAVDMDVRWTSDGVAVLAHHSETATSKTAFIRRTMTCNDRKRVVEKSRWADLQKHCHSWGPATKGGKQHPVVTYDEAVRELAALPGVQIFAEIKDADQTSAEDAKFLATITKYGMLDRTVVTSYDRGALMRIGRVAADQGLTLRRMLNIPDEGKTPLPSAAGLKKDGFWGACLRSDRVTTKYFSSLRSAGLVAVAQDRVTLKNQAKDLKNGPRTWAAMRTAGATIVLTDQPGAYKRWHG